MKINFSIEELDRGFVVNVGCKRIATENSFDDIIAELKRYFATPYEVQKEYFPDDFAERVECSDACVPTPVQHTLGGLR